MLGITRIVSLHDLPVIELNLLPESHPAFTGSTWLEVELSIITGGAVHGPTIGHGPTITPGLAPPPALLEGVVNVVGFVGVICFDVDLVSCFSFLSTTFSFSTFLSLTELVVGTETWTTGGWTTCFLNHENGFHQEAKAIEGVKNTIKSRHKEYLFIKLFKTKIANNSMNGKQKAHHMGRDRSLSY